MAVLITGGSGFVGLKIAEQLLSRGRTIVTLANPALPEAARRDFMALPGTFVSVQGDVRDADVVRRAIIEYEIDRARETRPHSPRVTPGLHLLTRRCGGMRCASLHR